jgi:hypothetical protein
MLKPSPTGNVGQKPPQWINENECKTTMALSENEVQFRKTMFQV